MAGTRLPTTAAPDACIPCCAAWPDLWSQDPQRDTLERVMRGETYRPQVQELAEAA